jgi:diacylglycerol O-acyltransferase / wax synthase
VSFAERVRAWFDDDARMASVDRAWLRMEEPANLMVVNALLVLGGPLSQAELAALVGRRLAWIRRLRVHVEDGWLGPRWAEGELELDAHVREQQLPAPGDDAALQALVSGLVSIPLEPDRPLWQLHLIQGYRPRTGVETLAAAGGSVILARVHHSLGDGLALLLVLLSLTDVEAEPTRANPLQALFAGQAARRSQPPARGDNERREVVERAREFLREVMPAGMKLMLHHDLRADDHAAPDPSPSTLTRASRAARLASAVGRDLASLVLRQPDSPTVFRGSLAPGKQVAWSRAIALPQLRERAHALGSTINDLLLSAMTGGLRRYIGVRGDDPAGVELRAAVPINLRGLAEIARLGNRFGLVFLTLPVGIADPDQRLAEIHRRMHALKHSVEPLVTWGILELMGSSPKWIEERLVDYFAKRVSFVMTNVPGPERRLYLAGRELTDLMFWVPQSGRVGLGVSMLSYADTVRIGIACDARLVPDPDRLIASFHAELDQLEG